MNTNKVIAVNEQDEILGYLDKMEAHRKGVLHRAISVFIINSNGKWLLQQRAADKYHSGLLWSNTACTHPFSDESNDQAAKRRLLEEMGLTTELTKLFTFQYKAILENQLIENELDHIYMGITDEVPILNTDEVINYRYVSLDELIREVETTPEKFTPWFLLLFKKLLNENHLLARNDFR